MKNIQQSLKVLVKEKVKAQVRAVLDAGDLQVWVEQEINGLLEDALNTRLKEERDEFLGRESSAACPSEGIYRNGFRKMVLPGPFGRLKLNKPVLREGGFIPRTLEALREGTGNLMAHLGRRFWIKGASTRSVAQELNEVFGTKHTANQVSQWTQDLEPMVAAWEKRPLAEGIRYLYLDALYVSLKCMGSYENQALLVAIGVDGTMHRHFLGFVVGDSESKESWGALLDDLLSRGLDRKVLKLVVSDAHASILAAAEEKLSIPHQLCVVHKMRNVRLRVAAKDQREFLQDFTKVYWADGKNRALIALGELKAKWGKAYPKAVAMTEKDFEKYTVFFQQDSKDWMLLRSTNLIERFNRELRRRFKPVGGMTNERTLVKLLWGVATAQQERWNRIKVHTSRKEVKNQAA